MTGQDQQQQQTNGGNGAAEPTPFPQRLQDAYEDAKAKLADETAAIAEHHAAVNARDDYAAKASGLDAAVTDAETKVGVAQSASRSSLKGLAAIASAYASPPSA